MIVCRVGVNMQMRDKTEALRVDTRRGSAITSAGRIRDSWRINVGRFELLPARETRPVNGPIGEI